MSTAFKEKPKDDEVFNETPIKVAKDHLKIEEGDSEKKKLKENLFVLVPRIRTTSILKNKKGNFKKS